MVGEGIACAAGCSQRTPPLGLSCPKGEPRCCPTHPDHYKHGMNTMFLHAKSHVQALAQDGTGLTVTRSFTYLCPAAVSSIAKSPHAIMLHTMLFFEALCCNISWKKKHSVRWWVSSFAIKQDQHDFRLAKSARSGLPLPLCVFYFESHGV
jgi:hypothetical protein